MAKKEEPVAEVKPVEVKETPTAAPKELIEISAPAGMSEAERKKLEELSKMKRAGTLKKQEAPKNDLGLPKLTADALPPVQMGRKGQFEMIPDFLQ